MTNERNANPKAGITRDAGGLTILLADDEGGIRHVVGQVLRSHGYTVLEAADGVEALEVAEQHPGPIHLLLTDWCMPRLDGEGLIRCLTNGRPETATLVYVGLHALRIATCGNGFAQAVQLARSVELGERGAPRAGIVTGGSVWFGANGYQSAQLFRNRGGGLSLRNATDRPRRKEC